MFGHLPGRLILLLLVVGVLSFAAQTEAWQQPPDKTASPPAKAVAPPGKATLPATQAGTPAKPGTTQEKPGAAPAKMEKKPAPVKSAEAKTSIITRTFDGVDLRGDFYPAPEGKGRKTPVVVLLHAVGPRRLAASRKDFDKLPEQLQKQGYAVVTFDFRGYGESKTIEPQDFIKYNRIKNTKNPERIEGKDYSSSADLLTLANDLVAIKVWLNKKNNSGDCNSNLIALVAVEQSAVVATAWIASEFSDPNRSKEKKNTSVFIPGIGTVQGQAQPGFAAGAPGGTSLGRMEGDDVVCLVAVSSSNRLNDNLSLQLLERWHTFLREKKVATLAVYGANDKDATTYWNRAAGWIKPPKEKDRFKNSGVRPVKNTNLIGAKLLLNETLEVSKSLEEYLAQTVKKVAEMRLWTEQPGTEIPGQVDIERLLR